jgi:hypothetical protein
MRKTHKVWSGNGKETHRLEKPRRRLNDNIKTDLELRREAADRFFCIRFLILRVFHITEAEYSAQQLDVL